MYFRVLWSVRAFRHASAGAFAATGGNPVVLTAIVTLIFGEAFLGCAGCSLTSILDQGWEGFKEYAPPLLILLWWVILVVKWLLSPKGLNKAPRLIDERQMTKLTHHLTLLGNKLEATEREIHILEGYDLAFAMRLKAAFAAARWQFNTHTGSVPSAPFQKGLWIAGKHRNDIYQAFYAARLEIQQTDVEANGPPKIVCGG